VPSAGTPFGVHPRSRVEVETRRREGPQSSTQQPARPNEEDEDFNSSLGSISPAGTTMIFLWSKSLFFTIMMFKKFIYVIILVQIKFPY